MKADVTVQHAWLRRLVGEWRYEGESVASAEQPAMKTTGTESVRMLGDVWLICEGRGQMPEQAGGGPALSMMTLGYDPVAGHFVGTWIGSMMNHLWIYRSGSLDSSGHTLALDAEGPAFDGPPGTLAQYRDVIELVSADERLLHGHVLGPDGRWVRFMTTRYRRIG